MKRASSTKMMSLDQEPELSAREWPTFSDDSDSSGCALSSTTIVGRCGNACGSFSSALATCSIDAACREEEEIVYMPRSYLLFESGDSMRRKAQAPLGRMIDAFGQRNGGSALLSSPPGFESHLNSSRFRSSTAPAEAGRRSDAAPAKQRSQSVGHPHKTKRPSKKSKALDSLTQNFVKFLSKSKEPTSTSWQRSMQRRNTDNSIWYDVSSTPGRHQSALRHGETSSLRKPARYLSQPANLNHLLSSNIMTRAADCDKSKSSGERSPDSLSVHSSSRSSDSFCLEDCLFESSSFSETSCVSLDQMLANFQSDQENSMMSYLLKRFSLSSVEQPATQGPGPDKSQFEKTHSVAQTEFSRLDGLELSGNAVLDESSTYRRQRRFMLPIRFKRGSKSAPKSVAARKRSNTAPPFLLSDSVLESCDSSLALHEEAAGATSVFGLDHADAGSILPGTDLQNMLCSSEVASFERECNEAPSCITPVDAPQRVSSIKVEPDKTGDIAHSADRLATNRSQSFDQASQFTHGQLYSSDKVLTSGGLAVDPRSYLDGLGEVSGAGRVGLLLGWSETGRRCVTSYARKCISVETCV